MNSLGITTIMIGKRDLRELFAAQYGAVEHPPVVGTTFDGFTRPPHPGNVPNVAPTPVPEPALPAGLQKAGSAS
jgi:hypothetical protein